MPVPDFTVMSHFFEALKTQFTNDSVFYGHNLDIMDRLRLNKPKATEDVVYIYAEINRFNTELLPAVSVQITTYLNNSSLFKSKKEINAFVTELKSYASFYEEMMRRSALESQALNSLEADGRSAIAQFTPLIKLELKIANDEVAKNSYVVAEILRQKNMLYVFSKVLLITYNMINQVAEACQKAKKKPILSPNHDYDTLDVFTEKFERERASQSQVATDSRTHAFAKITDYVAEYWQSQAMQTRQLPMERYTLDNRLVASKAPSIMAPLIVSPQNSQLRALTSDPQPCGFHGSVVPSEKMTESSKHVMLATIINHEKLSIANQQYTLILSKLKKKTDELILKSTNGSFSFDERYIDAGRAAQLLIEQLEQAGKRFFTASDEQFRDPTEAELALFKKTCENAINDSRKEFSHHRQFWGKLDPLIKEILGVLALITVFPAVLVSTYTKQGYMGTFFAEQPTDSAIKLTDFERDFKELRW